MSIKTIPKCKIRLLVRNCIYSNKKQLTGDRKTPADVQRLMVRCGFIQDDNVDMEIPDFSYKAIGFCRDNNVRVYLSIAYYQ